tara:strand:- start:10941 stop:11726 length:786 start_codon:yes stop_codon:yes gene_type:complete
MQLVSKYLLNNNVTLTANLAGEITEYRSVYQRNLNIAKGIDNPIQFNVLNADQKPVSILNTYTPKFQLYDENNRLIVSRDGTVIETSTPSKVGHFTVTIAENDLLNIKSQYMHYTVYLQKNSDSTKTILHSGVNFENKGTVYISTEEFPGPVDSYSVTTFIEDNPGSGVFVSETVTAEPTINGNSALHTVAYYLDEAVGDIVVQGTLANQIDGNTFWTDINTFASTDANNLKYVNFNGVYSYLRFKHTLTSGSVTKILIRN